MSQLGLHTPQGAENVSEGEYETKSELWRSALYKYTNYTIHRFDAETSPIEQ